MAEKKKDETTIQKVTEKVEEIVQAITPPWHPASQDPGGIPVTDAATEEEIGTKPEFPDPVNPGGIPNV